LVVLGLPIAKRVLIILAHASDVGLTGNLNAGANLHPVTISFMGLVSIGIDCIDTQTLNYKGLLARGSN
jgi:hypothetical protein